MQLSTKGRYAVMAMVDLASWETAERPGGLSCLADIAARQQLSQAYLEQLFGKLRRAGLVRAARGPGGGYCLARPAAEIVIAEIVAAVDEPIRATRCEAGGGGCMAASGGQAGAEGGEKCQTHDLWVELGRQITLFLHGISLADVVLGHVAGRAVFLPRFADIVPRPMAAGSE
ncbi:MAG TPA: Rrf2 family transcriptional regulator [Rhodopila sp.]|jgi:Rrf2 family iron-sulfur cluster assembly transcriptional regulator|nr:Rrf2 family transcriptional regulator [Rhodopila sp.]